MSTNVHQKTPCHCSWQVPLDHGDVGSLRKYLFPMPSVASAVLCRKGELVPSTFCEPLLRTPALSALHLQQLLATAISFAVREVAGLWRLFQAQIPPKGNIPCDFGIANFFASRCDLIFANEIRVREKGSFGKGVFSKEVYFLEILENSERF